MGKSAILLTKIALATASAIALLVMSEAARAQTGGYSLYFTALKWRSIGPLRGGRSIAAAGSARRPLEYYFGATGGGLWKTTDGGVTWRPVSDTFFKTSSVGAVAVSESNPDIVYAGMGETELRGNIIQGDGVYKSIDAGRTWTAMGLVETQAIARVRVHPTNPDVVFVAAFGNPYGPNAGRGIFRSRNGGRSWQKVLHRNDKTGASDLIFDAPTVARQHFWRAQRLALWGDQRALHDVDHRPPLATSVLAVGAAEALVPLFVAFGALTIAWLCAAVGLRQHP